MDKFGIFNLLNSFFNFYQDKKDGDNESSGGFGDRLFSGIFNQQDATDKGNGVSNASSSSSNSAKTKQAGARGQNAVQKPLQEQMLNTITTHDQIVRRVKAKNQ